MIESPPVPHLKTALKGPLLFLEKHFLQNQVTIETWLRDEWTKTPPPFYASVDLRNAGFKLAPVDTNLFPAGFNNLNPDFMPLCVQAAQAAMFEVCPKVSRVLLVTESHTRNIHYFENVVVLRDILKTAGFFVRVGTVSPDVAQPIEHKLPSRNTLTILPINRKGARVEVDNFDPQMLLLNNDLSGTVPEVIQDIEQMIRPPLAMGWATRLKSRHFQHYQDITQVFARHVDIDPWLITPLFRKCGEVNFLKREGEDCLVHHADALLTDIRAKYREHNIQEQPYVVVKADAGTYGMAVMMISDPEALRRLNRKQRVKMSASKGGIEVTKVIIQEGVHTFETVGDHVAEPVVYLMGRHVIGGFYRIHSKKGKNENLNSPGMHFEPLAFAETCNMPTSQAGGEPVNRFYAYGVVGRLALLAAARELTEIK